MTSKAIEFEPSDTFTLAEMQWAEEAVCKIADDLAWRGPGGQVAGYVVVPRHMAAALLRALGEINTQTDRVVALLQNRA